MPNHCENDLYVYGPQDRLDEVVEFIKSEDSDFDYNKIIPYPKKFTILDEKFKLLAKQQGAWNERFGFAVKAVFDEDGKQVMNGYMSGGYKWCIKNWGTKWNVYDIKFERRKKNLFYSWSSAWGPPTPVIDALAKKFPDLKFVHKYFERGMAFQGKNVYQDGDVKRWTGGYSGKRGG